MRDLVDLQCDIILAASIGNKRIVIDYTDDFDTTDFKELNEFTKWLRDWCKRYDVEVVLEFKSGNKVIFNEKGEE